MGIKKNRYDGNNYAGMGNIYKEREINREASKALKWYKKGIKVDPYLITNYYGLNRANNILDQQNKINSSKIIGILPKSIKKANAASIYIENLNHDNSFEVIYLWIKSDIEKIVKECQRRGIKIILQGYPRDHQVNNIIRQVANAHSIPFVDNFKVFKKLLKREKKAVYFVEDGHCNSKGYGVMAKNIYNRLLEEKYPSLFENKE